jgi:UDP-N-acetylmuramyl pentapeptide phosphotransferase/UDP-N-acetylglucosamine-1-phosphate transferase
VQSLQPVWRWPTLAGFLAGATIVAVVSWIDDLRNLPSLVRLLAHSLAAVVAIVAIQPWPAVDLPLLGQFPLGWFGYPLAFLWIVGMINIYNFMDGIDGLAGGQAVVAAVGWVLIGWWSGQADVLLLAALLGASSLGFLGHNWPPARIFMGDVGSTFLGYSFAALSLLAGQRDPGAFAIGILLLWPFLFDAGLTILRRLRKGENILASHRSHLYQRLVIVKHNHLVVTVGYILLAAAGVLAAVAWRLQWPGGALLVVLLIPLLAFGLFFYTSYCEHHAAT